MTLFFFILLIFISLILMWLLFDMKKKMKGPDEEKLTIIAERLKMISEDHEKLRSSVDNKLSEVHRSGEYQSKEAHKIIGDVTTRLASLDKTNERFSTQLQNLQDILKNPKQRGVLGEFILESVLANVLPPDSFQMQYAFKDAVIVDAVIFVKEKIIPIDSKFSLENYEQLIGAKEKERRRELEKSFKQDLKNRIDETSKYIKPAEGTTDFAFMFIPSEAIYYDLLANKVGAVQMDANSMIEYAARDKHVIIVSPTTFFAYLLTVLQGLRSFEIEENVKDIKVNVETLGKHIASFDGYMNKLGKSMGTTVNHYNTAYKELNKIDKDVVKITGRGKQSVEPLEIERPKSADLD